MRFTLLSLLPATLALPAALNSHKDGPVYWVLAGDSTTATNGGWGDAFLATTVSDGSSGKNYGHSGATTKSFRAGGDWGEVIDEIGTHKDDYQVYVTIQVEISAMFCIHSLLTIFSSVTTTRRPPAASHLPTTRSTLRNSPQKPVQRAQHQSWSLR